MSATPTAPTAFEAAAHFERLCASMEHPGHLELLLSAACDALGFDWSIIDRPVDGRRFIEHQNGRVRVSLDGRTFVVEEFDRFGFEVSTTAFRAHSASDRHVVGPRALRYAGMLAAEAR